MPLQPSWSSVKRNWRACLQAIRDGVIEASIDHDQGYMQSKENMDIYCTREPQAAFHQRICFCLDIHNQSVKVRPAHSTRFLSFSARRKERTCQARRRLWRNS